MSVWAFGAVCSTWGLVLGVSFSLAVRAFVDEYRIGRRERRD